MRAPLRAHTRRVAGAPTSFHCTRQASIPIELFPNNMRVNLAFARRCDGYGALTIQNGYISVAAFGIFQTCAAFDTTQKAGYYLIFITFKKPRSFLTK